MGSTGGMARRTLTISSRSVVRFHAHRGFHGHQRHHLEQMVLNHVADGARLLVELAPAEDPEGLGHGDLEAGDVAAVPHRLEEGVGEAEDEQVFHRLFAQIVVDAEDLLLGEDAVQRVVQLPGAVPGPARRASPPPPGRPRSGRRRPVRRPRRRTGSAGWPGRTADARRIGLGGAQPGARRSAGPGSRRSRSRPRRRGPPPRPGRTFPRRRPGTHGPAGGAGRRPTPGRRHR